MLAAFLFLRPVWPQGAAQPGTPPPPAATTAAVPQPASPSAPLLLPDDPAALLGLGLAEVWARFGAPDKVLVSRGDEAWQDDVVFAYEKAVSLYWSVDRLWQLRFGAGYAGSVYGIFVGDAAEKVVSTLGTPYFRDDSNLVFRLAYRGYPVRLRTAIAAGKVTDIYVYRADF
jgi:hypothetical protein